MTLKDYIAENEIDMTEFADKIGCSVGGLKKWISGDRTPRRWAIERIVKATKGKVRPADFFEG